MTVRAAERADVPSVTAVIVSYADPASTRAAVVSLLAQSHPPLEVLVVDNHPQAPLVSDAPSRDARVRVLHSGQNLGYTAACNLAAVQAHGEWLFFLNPDARAEPGCLEALLGAADPATAILGAQVLLPDGRTNAGDNPLHLSGISWAGRYGLPREHGRPREVAAVSGAALLARAEAFAALGGLCERFFLYHDDADLCWRARLSGWTVRFCPEALVTHDYEFQKGTEKWFWLERNRLWSVLANYSAVALALLAPMLLAAEVAVLARALSDGWLLALARAWGSTARSLGELRRWRRGVQSQRMIGDAAVTALMATRFETDLMDSGAVRRVGVLLDGYCAIVRWALARLGC